MTRSDLLQYIEQARAQRRANSGPLVLGVAAFCALGGWMIARGHPEGWGSILFFGGGAGTGIIMGLFEPEPTYEDGRLEARLAWGATLTSLLAMAAAIVGALLFAQAYLVERRDLIFGLCVFLGVVLLLRGASLFRPGPALVIDAQGLYDSRAMRRPVDWDEVVSFDRVEKSSQVFYRLQLRDAAALSWISRFNGVFGIEGATINCLGLTCGQGDMLLAIQAHRPSLLNWAPSSAVA